MGTSSPRSKVSLLTASNGPQWFDATQDDYLNDQIAIFLGGRIAEELTNDNITTGAGNDLERATELARRMACEWGMSDAIGPLTTFGKKETQPFLGRDVSQHRDHSAESAIRIDQEITRIVTSNYDRARKDTHSHKSELAQIAETLLIREVLDADQVKQIAKGLPLEDQIDAQEIRADGAVDRPEDQPASIVPPPSLDKAVPQE